MVGGEEIDAAEGDEHDGDGEAGHAELRPHRWVFPFELRGSASVFRSHESETGMTGHRLRRDCPGVGGLLPLNQFQPHAACATRWF